MYVTFFWTHVLKNLRLPKSASLREEEDNNYKWSYILSYSYST